MLKVILFAVATLLASGNLASAQSKHIHDIQTIDAALPSAKLSAAQKARVVKLRNEGEKLHYAGKHGKAEVVLEKAKAILHVN
ncbi:MAG TPA: hypothetical protein VIJ67_06180 [Pseudolabrys sp.]|jgi:hypothetical protein